MNLSNLVRFKKSLGNAIYSAFFKEKIDINKLIEEYILIGGDLKDLLSYLNILNMYDIESSKNILLHPTLLITIDNDIKLLAWVLRQYNIKNLDEYICDLRKNLI